ncbi:MAG: phosphoenolpyruvate--protein phosphotransferase [Gemmatimonadales bacterium]|nr:phosphoenolpyruvate--protein phosphotransferase [Gemmatimonadales bacterium]
MFSLHGTGLGGGIAIARARRLVMAMRDVVRFQIEPHRVGAEMSRLDAAMSDVRVDLEAISEQLPEDSPPEGRALLDIHLMILEDPALLQGARANIVERGWNAEWSLASQAERLAEQFAAFEDPYLRERGRDVIQVAERVLKALAGSRNNTVVNGGEPAIYAAEDIAPADMLSLRNALGFALDTGGSNSHSAILARSMNVPAVVGLGGGTELIRDDDWLILDGDRGLMIVAPDESVLAEYRHRQAAGLLEREKLKRLIKVPCRTLDRIPVELLANIEMPEEAEQARAEGAVGIGLYRSEFLFMNRRELPDEDEQYEAYRAAVVAMDGLPVTIRTLDVGADKALDPKAPASGPNPALGLRAIRYSLARQEMFLVQLRAMLRASASGPLRILLPMLTHGHEVDSTRALLDLARQQLRSEGRAFDEEIQVGGMIEVPAAAMSAAYFARRLDFLSIGTNDLIQYTLAIDRSDHTVASLYDSFHPAVLRLVAMTIRAADRAGKPVSVCGELAGNPQATRLLLGMGLRQFSMYSANLLRVKREILLADAGRLASRVTRMLHSDDPVRVRAQLDKLAAEA